MISSSLKEVSGVYAFQLISSGELVYYGSSVNLARRFVAHINGNSSNIILQRAFAKYGISAFCYFRGVPFQLGSFYPRESGLTPCPSPGGDGQRPARGRPTGLEQKYLDSFKPPYNIAKNATASFTGLSNSDEAKAAMSVAKIGSNNPNYGKTGSLNPMYGKTGSLNPMYGTVPSNASPVYLYNTYLVLLNEFSSREAAAQWLNVSRRTVGRYISSGKVLNGKYIVTYSL
ncbi:hypothetical protein BC938DRAFT_476332 [Jimgerdemannia flammicorona]|uniref:GIY-YIG domain-containing protein n=1 Tax=Jimgerdemannia flammicorona TaxID=994334 RepID=A0A433PI74_9FUNG|nr:hypothetical protein BC938DRAFT_476332 [Jimgerdemannia flammicorona]